MNILAIETSCDETSAAIIQGPLKIPDTTEHTSADAENDISPEHQSFCRKGAIFKEAGATKRGALSVRRASSASADAEDDTFPAKTPKILSNVVVSQINIFAEYGGVIPEIAARSHLEAILPVIRQAFSQAGLTWDDIDAIAVTHTPGLLGSLLIGTLTARVLAILHNKPLYAVHHLKSHIYSAWLQDSNPKIPQSSRSSSFCRERVKFKERGVADRAVLEVRRGSNAPLDEEACPLSAKPSFPLLALVVSGGHTQVIYMKKHNHFEIIGTTRDDAVGECFDKVAKILGLPYPGGPAIAAAANGLIKTASNPKPHQTSPGDPHKYHFPHPKLTHPPRTNSFCQEGISFKEAGATERGALSVRRASNASVDAENDALLTKPLVFFPPKHYSGDNAAMVATAAYYEILSGTHPTDPYTLNISPRSPIS